MQRRELLRKGVISATGIAASSLFGCSSFMSASQQEGKTAWGYIGEKGPENWGSLSKEFNICQAGNSQSPVNLESTVDADLTPLEINYKDSPLRVINNGHTIQVNYQPGSFLTLDGERYELLQFHFHHPSEHKVEGENSPMELHLVHKGQQGNLAVIGVFLKEGKSNPTLRNIWQEMPIIKSDENTIPEVSINALELLPENKDYYRYFGSLTTPPCSETVNWIVLKEPVEISIRQVKQFAQIFPMNARPIQLVKRRFVLE